MSIHLSSFLAAFLFSSLSFAQSTLSIAAAADLAPAEQALSTSFEKAHPSVRLRFVNGASATLAQQIKAGAPLDVFLSANTDLVDQLHLNSPKTYAIGHVALLWRDGKVHPVADLAASRVRFVAVPNPKLAPYGLAAQRSLGKVWDQISPKLVYGENVRQALQLFDSGNADAVLTAESLVINRHPQLLAARVVQKAGIIPATTQNQNAQLFLDWLLSARAHAILATFGFEQPVN